MAKSKSGGTRSYIRGKIGADVYSVGKDGKGKRQQVVRSLAEQVANPQTEAQMFGRMVMSTVMQAVSAMKPVIDHSFDGIPAGQPSISEFIRSNYALVKADATAHPASGNSFGLNKYHEKGAMVGTYVISNGDIVVPSVYALDADGARLTLTLESGSNTVGALKTLLEVNNDEDFFTLVGLQAPGTNSNGFAFARVRINPSVADETVISSQNVASCFVTEGNVAVNFNLSGTSLIIYIAGANNYGATGVILSRKQADGWKHSKCTLTLIGTNPNYPANTALPTYPQGSARFLNGGDI